MLCWQMALDGEREKYFGDLLQRETAILEATCQAPGAGIADCGSAPEVSVWAASPVLAVAALRACAALRCMSYGMPEDACLIPHDSTPFGSNCAVMFIPLRLQGHGLQHVVRFVEWFQEPGRDLWLVFRDEGVSLHALMYDHVALAAEVDPGACMLQWLRMLRCRL